MRRVTIFLCLASIAVGTWLLFKEHSLVLVCKSAVGTTGFGLNANCLSAVTSYFMGFALMTFGVLFLVMAVFVMARRQDSIIWRNQNAAVTRLRHEEEKKLRDAA
jgi:Ca2+-dependent lipid-binding protein